MLEEVLASSSPREKLGVAYTYNEPGVWYEFVLETARFLHEKGYKNILVTNGYLNPEPLAELLPFIDAMNIDVKAFSDSFYRRFCRGKGLTEVLRTVEQALGTCHGELTYLVIGTLNDSPAEVGGFIDWVASLDREIPVHFSRYFPGYRLEVPATPLPVMESIWETAVRKLSYVYLGNAADENRSATYCPSCGTTLIRRTGSGVRSDGLQGKSCKNCGYTIRLEGWAFS
jgi:pyruvate formate lyase activating enzyme